MSDDFNPPKTWRVTLTRFGNVTVKEYDNLNTAFWTAAEISGRMSTPGPFKVEMEEIVLSPTLASLPVSLQNPQLP